MGYQSGEIALLHFEDSLPTSARERRTHLVQELRRIGAPEHLKLLQYLQPQAGCFNACHFCAQDPAKVVWRFDKPALLDVLSALKTVALEVELTSGRVCSTDLDAFGRWTTRATPLLGYARSHRPSQIFPYLDDDPFSYPHLADYLRVLEHDFGCTARLTTVGYSRKNKILMTMHDEISQHLSSAIASLRISVTPYTLMWRHSNQSNLADNEFAADLTQMLRQYRAFGTLLGFARDRYCVEFRTAPLVQRSPIDLTEYTIDGRHVISLGPYLAVATTRGSVLPISDAAQLLKTQPGSQTVGSDYVFAITNGPNAPKLAISDIASLELDPDTHRMMHLALSDGSTMAVARRRVVRLRNIDGYYFSIGGLPSIHGYRTEVNLYPRTETRQSAAAIYRVRHFLNHLIDFKRDRGLDRRASVPGATWADAEQLLVRIATEGASFDSVSPAIARHVEEDLLSIIRLALFAMKTAGHPARDFFDYGFLWDTGSVTNLGRALKTIFNGVVSRWYHPLSLNEEKGYEYHPASASGQRQSVLRIAPAPAAQSDDSERAHRGFRTPTAIPGGGLTVELLDSHIQPIGSYQHIIAGVPVTLVSDSKKLSHSLVPGA